MIEMEISNDRELMARMSLDDHEAFAQIYENYWKQMLHVAWSHTKDKTLSEDIVHEVFMRLWDNRHNKQIENIQAFLQTAVKYSVFAHYRKEKRRKELAVQNITYVDSVDDESVIDALFLEQYIKSVLDIMPEKSRLVFQYSRVDGLKNQEIADLMKISEKGVEANLTRALKFLRNQMKRDGLVLLLVYDVLKDYLPK